MTDPEYLPTNIDNWIDDGGIVVLQQNPLRRSSHALEGLYAAIAFESRTRFEAWDGEDDAQGTFTCAGYGDTTDEAIKALLEAMVANGES